MQSPGRLPYFRLVGVKIILFWTGTERMFWTGLFLGPERNGFFVPDYLLDQNGPFVFGPDYFLDRTATDQFIRELSGLLMLYCNDQNSTVVDKPQPWPMIAKASG